MITKDDIKNMIQGKRFKYGIINSCIITETITSKEDLLFRIDTMDGVPEELTGPYHTLGYDYRIDNLLIRINPWAE